MQTEPILEEDNCRFVLLPIRHPDIWEFYQMAKASFWTAEEIDLSSDLRDWGSLNDNERHFVSHVLAFFAASDGIVNENLAKNFLSEVQYTEARFFYSFQVTMDLRFKRNIHCTLYDKDAKIKKLTRLLKLTQFYDDYKHSITKLW